MPSSQILISVMMDVSDGARFLDKALASLAGQSFRDFEIVLCAHGATPETTDCVNKWQAREDRLRVLWSPRLPLAQAHNLVARAARAPYLARLDADDIALPHRLEHQFKRFQQDPRLALLGSGIQIIDCRGRALSTLQNPADHEAIYASLPVMCPIVHSTMMVRAEAFWNAGGYRKGLNLSEDYDLYTRVLEQARGANCHEPLVQYRVHPNSLSATRTDRMAITNFCVAAAVVARRTGAPEPFVAGVPSLRRAQDVLALSRGDLLLRIRSTRQQTKVSRYLLANPLPFGTSALVRRAAVGIGMRPAYSLAFRLSAKLARRLARR